MKKELLVLAHNIRSTYNVGSFFRTADGAGVTKLILSGYTARPPHKGITKTALGAEHTVAWEGITAPGPWLRQMKKQGYRIVGLEQSRTSKNIFSYRPKWPMILIVGNEVRGISPALLKLSDDIIHLPMEGRKESLNVASAMAVGVYSLLYGQR